MNKPSGRSETTRVFPVESNCRVVGGMSLTRLAERIGSTLFYAYDRRFDSGARCAVAAQPEWQDRS